MPGAFSDPDLALVQCLGLLKIRGGRKKVACELSIPGEGGKIGEMPPPPNASLFNLVLRPFALSEANTDTLYPKHQC